MKSIWKAKIIYNNLVFVCSFRKKMKFQKYNCDDSENFKIFEAYIGVNSKKTKLSFTDWSII